MLSEQRVFGHRLHARRRGIDRRTYGLDASRLSEEEIPCCSEMKYCGVSPAALNVAAVMGFNYAYEGFPTC